MPPGTRLPRTPWSCGPRRSACSGVDCPTPRPRRSCCRARPVSSCRGFPAAARRAPPARAWSYRARRHGNADRSAARQARRPDVAALDGRVLAGGEKRGSGVFMSGHNRWTKIKRKKEAMGATKGALFTKLIREVTVAARNGGGDPEHNARLRSAVLAAREANMPNETIQRAIKKGTGELEGVSYEEMVYEGYGPGGVAIVCEVLTDNKNRTAGDVRSLFTKGGGSMATTGAVAFQFERKGVIPVKKGPAEDQVMEFALDAGAEDVIPDGEGGFEVRTDTGALMQVHKALEAKVPVGAPRMMFLPKNSISVSGETAEKVLK